MGEDRVIVYRVGVTYAEVWEFRNDKWILVGITVPIEPTEPLYREHNTLAEVCGPYGAAYTISSTEARG